MKAAFLIFLSSKSICGILACFWFYRASNKLSMDVFKAIYLKVNGLNN